MNDMTPQEIYEAHKEKARKGKRLWWLKLPKDFFSTNNVIKKMRKLPGGDTYVVVTLKILLLALDHDFRIYYEGVEDTFVKDIALTLDETEESVAGALKVLIQQGWLVQEDEETLYSLKSEEMAGSETPDAKRMRIKRLGDKELALNAPEQCSNNVQECSGNVRLEKRREEKRRTEIEKMQEEKEGSETLSVICPDAFTEGKEKSLPSLSDVQQYASLNRFTDIPPEEFYDRFASQDWTDDGKDITDWRVLYLTLEGLARAEGGEDA